MILSAHTTRQLRNASLSALYRVAYDHDVDISDVMASIAPTRLSIAEPMTDGAIERLMKAIDDLEPITPSQPPSRAPAARTSEPATPDVQAEESPHGFSADLNQPARPDVVVEPVDAGAACEPVPQASPLSSAPTQVGGALAELPNTPSPEPQPTSTPATDDPIPSKPARGRPETTRAKIVTVHAEHPEWPSKLIAEHLGITEDAVRATASRKGLKLVSWWDYQRTLPAEQRTVPARPAPTEPTNRDRVREAHTEHPDFTAKELALHLGMDELNLRAVASQLGIKLPKAKSITPPARVTLADKIRAHLAEHPNATVGEIATATGHRLQAIGWAAQKAGITLRKRTTEERSEASRRSAPQRQPKPQEPVERREPPTPQPAPEQPPATSPAEPFDDEEPAPLVRRVNRAPTGRFYLREKSAVGAEGRYVHQSLQASPTGPGPLMTSDRKWAWYDTMERYRGAVKQWPQLAGMRKEGAQP